MAHTKIQNSVWVSFICIICAQAFVFATWSPFLGFFSFGFGSDFSGAECTEIGNSCGDRYGFTSSKPMGATGSGSGWDSFGHQEVEENNKRRFWGFYPQASASSSSSSRPSQSPPPTLLSHLCRLRLVSCPLLLSILFGLPF